MGTRKKTTPPKSRQFYIRLAARGFTGDALSAFRVLARIIPRPSTTHIPSLFDPPPAPGGVSPGPEGHPTFVPLQKTPPLARPLTKRTRFITLVVVPAANRPSRAQFPPAPSVGQRTLGLLRPSRKKYPMIVWPSIGRPHPPASNRSFACRALKNACHKRSLLYLGSFRYGQSFWESAKTLVRRRGNPQPAS